MNSIVLYWLIRNKKQKVILIGRLKTNTKKFNIGDNFDHSIYLYYSLFFIFRRKNVKKSSVLKKKISNHPPLFQKSCNF